MECGFSQFSDTQLCMPLQRLFDEHTPLRRHMVELTQIGTIIIENGGQNRLLFEQLQTQVTDFFTVLEPHSEKEEGILFPMVARYIGMDGGPIAVMEYEHDQAKVRIQTFFKGSSNLEQLTTNQIEELAALVVEACAILTEHFMKEEQILFPMAEHYLSDKEKEDLAKAFL
ncbi:hemerythrin domain-containing protein [Bacillus alkalicellulosilyticus]|uniref:hemerythrin domain-containing protein n=1 Tax=Alkalihalobacterium alkalicellulosilyticum TaxID=1912214 RepID=UPI0009983F23|nr:hemerythrin domain-containing protein [Bacillus alkalicellulosilyticus]